MATHRRIKRDDSMSRTGSRGVTVNATVGVALVNNTWSDVARRAAAASKKAHGLTSDIEQKRHGAGSAPSKGEYSKAAKAHERAADLHNAAQLEAAYEGRKSEAQKHIQAEDRHLTTMDAHLKSGGLPEDTRDLH